MAKNWHKNRIFYECLFLRLMDFSSLKTLTWCTHVLLSLILQEMFLLYFYDEKMFLYEPQVLFFTYKSFTVNHYVKLRVPWRVLPFESIKNFLFLKRGPGKKLSKCDCFSQFCILEKYLFSSKKAPNNWISKFIYFLL